MDNTLTNNFQPPVQATQAQVQPVQEKRVTIEKLMNSCLGESSSELRVSFRKTVLIKEYETEVVEFESTLKLDREVSAAERVILSAILQVQFEYLTYSSLRLKNLISPENFNTRKAVLESELEMLLYKCENSTGKSLQHLLEQMPQP